MYTVADYYNNLIPDDIEYYDYDEIDKQIDKCYNEQELHNDIEALLDERSWESSLRYMCIRRIAKEARAESISNILILKFFVMYNISDKERVWFWTEFYNN